MKHPSSLLASRLAAPRRENSSPSSRGTLVFQLLATLWLLTGVAGSAWAQCATTSTLNYRTITPATTRRGTGTVGNAGSANTFTDTQLNTSFTFNNYVKVGANAGTVTNNFTVGTNVNLGSNQTLLWQVSYPSTETVANNQARVTLTFNRAVSNLSLTLEDVDYAGAGGTWRDDIIFNGYAAVDANGVPTGTPIALTNANFTFAATTPTAAYLSGNEVQGTADNAAGNANGDVTVNFGAQNIRAVTLIYKNTTPITGTADRVQIVGLKSASFCAQADVTTTLAPVTTPVTAGTTGQFTVTFANPGEIASGTNTAYVQLPAGLTGVSATNGGVFNTANNRVEYPTGTATAAGSTFSSVVSFTAPATGPVNASSSIASSVAQQPDVAPNTATAAIAVTAASADVATTLTGPTTAPAGSFVTYTVTSVNNGPNTAVNNVMQVQLPTGLTTVSASDQGVYNATTGRVTFPGLDLGNGASVAYIVRYFMPASGSISGTGLSTATTADPTATNNNGSQANANVTTTATQVADVNATITGPTAALAGSTVTYSALYTNNGPSVATGVAAFMQLPAGLSGVVVSSGSYASGSGLVTFTVPGGGALASGASISYTVRYTAPASGSVTGTVSSTATTANGDPVAANNNGTAPAATVTTAVVTTAPTQQCNAPGRDGDVTTAAGTIVNTYYPGTANAAAGQNVVSIGAASPTGATALAVGDLVVIMQMQGAAITTTNDDTYGDGYAGGRASGYGSANLTAGQYEYGVVTAVTGTSVTLGSNLINSYQNADATVDGANNTTAGQRRFQVVRVPQYQSLTLGADLTTVPAWNGRAGGVLILDIAGQLNFGTNRTIDVSGRGFRGGAGRQLTGQAGFSLNDVRTTAAATTNAGKGEGIAGTPRYVNNSGALLDTRGTLLPATYNDGYPFGDNGKGAPGNAGGGGTDSNPNANDENTGGGGGSNAGFGGYGGNGWRSNLPGGGDGGSPFSQAAPSRLIMGGGGGAGTTNNGTGTPTVGFASSGEAGGGLVLIQASTVAGTGTINANGSSVTYVPDNDGSGGGGAGGSVLLLANNSLANVTVLTKGGTGGTNTGGGAAHGPGGGGSGGIILTSSAINAASSFAAGTPGVTLGNINYGATAGSTGTPPTRNNVALTETPLLEAAANCVADITTTLSGPTTIAAGVPTAPFTVTFTNNGLGIGLNITRTVTLPTGASLTAAQQTSITTAYPGATFSTTGTGATAVTTINFGTLASVAANATSSFTFSFTAPAATGAASITSNTTGSTNQGSDVAPNFATLNLSVVPPLSGFVYEDPNYGGGLGRARATAGTVARPGAIVELYNSATGAFVTRTVTDANGQYFLPGAASTAYTVRVVNSSVTSSRPGATFTGDATNGYVSTQLGVQTYNGSTDRVGGEYPGRTDAAANTAGANLNPLTGGSLAAESIAAITTNATGTTTGPDFGFNFDVVANTNASGQGSVAQFVANASALGGEATLAQAGSRVNAAGTTVALPAGKESSIFMISDGAAHAGLRAFDATTNPGLASQLTGGVAVITTAATLTISGANAANTVLDGTTQTANVGDTNAGTATNATATTVGVDGVALPGVQRPEVEISFTNLATGLDVEAASATVRGLALHGSTGATSATVLVGASASATGYLFENLVVGATAAGGRPTANTSDGYGLDLRGNSGVGTVQNALLAYTGTSGLNVNNGTGTAGTNQFLSNFFVKNGFTQAGGDGISFGDGGGSGAANIVGNLFTNQNSSAIQFEIGSTAATTVTNNSILNAGVVGEAGATVASLEGGGIVYLSRNGTQRGAQADVISRNVISNSQGAGIVVGYGQQNVTISQNNTNGNGGLGIDHINNANYYVGGPGAGAADYGNGDGVTVNDGNNPATAANTLPNRGVDFPVFTSATVVNGNLVIKGFARPGAVVELFIRDTDASNFGEGQTYLTTRTEGLAADDADTGTGSYAPNVNGLNQGTDAGASRFTFTIPYSTLTAAQQTALLANGLTGTTTLNSSTSEFSGKVPVNLAPVPNTLSNAGIPNTNGATVLNPNLSGTANGTANGAANTISYFTLTSVPATGTLTYNGTVLTATNIAATQITPALLGTLTYTPVSGSTVGSVSFQYTATDANGITSTTNNNGGTVAAGPATYTIPVSLVADVATTISASPSPVNAGGSLSIPVTFTNNGPSTAATVTRQVQLQAGLGAANVTATNGGTYDNTTGLVSYPSTATLANGANLNSTITIAAVPAGFATITATSTTSTTTGENGITANNTATLTPVTVTPVADVATTITPSPSPVNAGAALSFAITFTNNGPSTAAGYTRSITLPAGLGAGVTITGGTYNNATGAVTFTTPPTTLASGANANVTVTIPSVPAGFASITASSNTGTSTGQNGATANDNASSTVTVTPIADVATTISASPSPVNAGGTLTIPVTFTNNGPSTAATVTRQVQLQAGLGAANVTATNGGTYDNATGIVSYPSTATLANGANLNSTITITSVPAGFATITAVSTTSTTTGENGITANNTATLTPVTVTPVADVLTSLTGPATILQGVATGNYTAVFTNNGPSTAASVTRTVTLPIGASLTAAQQTTITTAYPGTTFSTTGSGATAVTTINFGTLTTQASGGTASYTFAFTAPAATGAVTATSNTSTTTGQNGATANDVSTLNITVAPIADVTATITGPAGPLTGNVATANNAYSVSFGNTGPSTAAGVTRIVTLPMGATLNAAQVAALVGGAVYTAPTGPTTSGTINFTNATGGGATQTSGTTLTYAFGLVPYNGNGTAGNAVTPAVTTATITTTTSQNGATANDTQSTSAPVKFSPVPAYVTAAAIPSTNGQTAIAALTAADQDGTIASFTIQTIPPGTQGTLYYFNGLVYLPVTGTITLTPSQATTLKFDPTGAFAGNVTFTYTATDNDGNLSTTYNNGGALGQGPAVYTIPVTANGISANNDSNVVPLNTPTVGNVLLNDNNPSGTGASVTTNGVVVTTNGTFNYVNGSLTTTHGTVTIAADGSYTYTPNNNYLGLDQFDYQVCTTSATPNTCATATVFIRVYDPGTACSSGTGPNLLANPSFNSGNTGFVTDYLYVSPAANAASGGGNTGLVPENTYAVTNDAHPYHPAFFAVGRNNATNPADQFMAINGSANVQRIYAQTVTVQPNRYYTFSAYFNNLIPPGTGLTVPELGFVINGESTSGTRIVSESPDRWVQASDIWYSGSNTTATFEIRNRSTAAGGNDFGIDDVYFGTCNLPPVANADIRTTPLNTNITFSATANDTDSDGSVVPSTFLFSNGLTSITVAGQGTFTVDGSGNVTFAPVTGFTGTSSVTYTVKDDNNASSNPGTISVTVGPVPLDLTTTIAAATNPVNAGATETLTVTAINNGVGTATNVIQTVQLPAGLTGVTFGTPTVGTGATLAAGSPSYNSATGLVTFPTIASQATGATGNVVYTVSFNAPSAGPFTATAQVGSTSNVDTNPANNTASVIINVNPQFDLVTTISGPTSAVQGDQITYTVTSANNGPSIAPNAVQTVTGLPIGLTQVFVSNGGTYNSATGTVTFPTVASFPNGLTQSNTISFTAPASGTVITPVAVLTPNTTGAGETVIANNTAGLNGVTGGTTTTTAPTAASANVQVQTLTTSVSSVAAGSPVTVNVTFGNAGPNAAAGVVYQLSLPPGTVITSTLPTGASYNSATGIVTLNSPVTLAAAGTQSYALTFTAPTTGPVLVAASVSSTTSDPVPADNFASTKVNILPSVADVATTINGPATVLAGQTASYAVTTTNNGPSPALNVVQTVELPAGLSATTLQFNGATGVLSGGIVTFTGGATYNVASGLLTLPTIATAASGSTTTNTVSFVAPAGAASYTATAAVSSTTPDGNAANNVAAVTTTVTPSVDVRTLISGPTSVPVFSPMTYSVTTINDGPSVAPTVVPTLQLPANLTNVVLPTGASYNSTTGLVTFATITNLVSGGAVTNSISFTMPDVAQVTGVAVSTVSGVTDRNAANNNASITTTSATPTDLVADLSATVTASAATVNAGAAVTFTATYNNGPVATSDAASTVRPLLALPAGLNVATIQVGGANGTYNAGTGLVTFPGGATYNFNTGIVTFPVTTSFPNSSTTGYAPLVYTVTVTAPGTSPLTATASISSATSDPAPANNQQTINVTITPQADLVTSISGPATVAAAGGAVSYAVTTTNNGASPAVNATTIVVLPIASGATYTVNGGAAQTYNGTGVTLPVVALMQSGANGAVTNTISFTSPSGTPGSTFAVTIPAGNVTTTTAETSTANNGSSITTTRFNQPPVAQDVVNSLQTPEGNTGGSLLISPLKATDADGTVATYQLTSIPPATQGVLYYNNNVDGTSGTYVALPVGQNLTQAQANTLKFDPATTYAGNVTFTYTATDNLGAVSNVAQYTIPVSIDIPSVYTNTPVKGGAGNPYATNDPISNVFDPNGGTANGTTITDTGTRVVTLTPTSGAGSAPALTATTVGGINYPANPTNVLPAGVMLNPVTGQLYVSNPALLVPGPYQVNITTVDVYGGVTTQPVRFIIGGAPVAVNDNVTTPLNTPINISVLTNDTPSGASTDPNAINVATVDLDPNTPGIQQGTAGSPIAVANGTAYVNALGVVTFTPATGFTGTTSFPYTVSNNAGQASNQATVTVIVTTPNPDEQVLLSVNNNPSIAGQPVVVTVTAQNNGVGTTTNVVPSAQIPSNLPTSGANAVLVNGATPTSVNGATGVATYAGGATYNPNTGLVTFPTIASQASGVANNVANTVTFTTPGNGPVLLTANVNNGLADPVPANNNASLTLNVTPRTDLATTVTGPATVVAGNQASYTVTTANNGPSAATGVVQTVQLPTGLINVYVSNGGTYNSGTGIVTFPAVNLANGQTVANTISLTSPTSNYSLTATVPTTNDPTTANNTSVVNTTVTTATATLANVSTTLTATAETTPGGTISYAVTVRNDGPSPAVNVRETLQLPTGLTGVVVSNGGSYNSATGLVTWPTIASLASAGSQSYTVTVPSAPAFGPVTATATASSDTSDPAPADNVASAQTTIRGNTDVATTISGPASATAGQPMTFVVTSSNVSNVPALGVQPTATILPGLAISGATAPVVNGAAPTGTSGGNATYAGGATYNPTTGVVTFPAAGTLAPGISVNNTVAYNAPGAGPVNTLASTSTTSTDGVPSNNSDAIRTTITPAADVVVTLAGPAGTATVGQPITYTVTTTNNGPSAATGEVTTVQLPTGLTIATTGTSLLVNGANPTSVSGTTATYANGVTYNSATGILTQPTITTLNVGSLNAVSNTITFLAPATSQVALTANANTTTTDPNLANNTASVTTPIAPATGAAADVAVTIVPSTTTTTPGTIVTYTVTTTNNGPNTANSVAQQVNLPAGLPIATSGTSVQIGGANPTSVSGTTATFANGATYNAATGLLTLPTLPTLANAATQQYLVQVPAPAVGPLLASATVTTTSQDNVPANNTAQATSVTITPTADVVTTLTGPATAPNGTAVTYTVTTTDNGPSPASTVQPSAGIPTGLPITGANAVLVNGQLPSSTSGVVATYPDGSTYNQTTGAVTFPAIGTLQPGQPVGNTVTFVTPTTGYTITATSSTTTSDPNAANNTATPITRTIANQPPVADNVVNSITAPDGDTGGQQLISPLAATDADGTIASYQLTSIPATTQGVLYYNNGGTYTAITAANFATLVLTPTQAATLKFDPATGFSGNAFFSYTATDNLGAVSQPALYTIPVASDIPALYTVAPPKGGTANPYMNGNVLATVFDVNGGTYDAAGNPTFNGLVSAVLNSGPLPAGTALDPITGQIVVTNTSLLVPGSYPLTITTTDIYGGVTVHNIVLVIGGSPVAVDDFATTNVNTAITFAVAGNDLANGGAAIAPGTIDLDPNTAGIQASITTAQGTFTTVGAPVGSVTFTPTSATFTGTATTPYTINNTASPAATSNQANLVVTVRAPLPVDLSTTITSNGPVNAGAPVTVTVTGTNNSAAASPNTVATVQLPAGLTTTGFTVAGQPGTVSGTTITFTGVGTYNVTTGLLTLNPVTLPANTTATVAIVFPAPATSFTATSTIGNGTLDPTPANNTASVPVVVTPQFDLATTITGPASVVTGGLATFTITSSNNGPSAVPNAVQTVQLATGLTGVYVTNGGYYNATAGTQTLYYVNGGFTTTNPGGGATAYTLAAGGVIFPPQTLSSGQTVTNTISFAVTSAFTPVATIAPNTTGAGDTNTANNTAYLNGAATATAVTVKPATADQANLYVTVTGPATVNPGATATYTVTQGNNGPKPAVNAVFTVSIPAGQTVASLTIAGQSGTLSGTTITFPNGATYSTTTGIVTFPTLATQASAATPQSFTIALTAPATGTFGVTANVTSDTTDPVAANNVATVMTNINPAADLALTITGPTAAAAGQVLTYTVTTTNNSGVPAANVAQSVTLPAGLLATNLQVGGQLGTLSGTTITFPNGATYNTLTGVLTLAPVGSLAGNTSQSTSISFTAPGNATSLTLNGTVTSTTPDGNLTNNSATATTTLSNTADVVVAVSGPATATVGNPVTYTVTTTNNGPSVAGSETTTVQLPTGLTGVVVRDNSGAILVGAYNATTGIVTFPAVTNLLPGRPNAQTGTITFNAPDTNRLDVTAIASVPAANNDPNLDNNSATTVTTVTPPNPTAADVAVTLVPNVTTQTPGQPVVYTLTTQNNTAANPATNVAQTVTLPAGLTTATLTLNGQTGSSQTGNIITFVGGPNNGATYNVTTGVLTLPVIASLVNGTPVVTTITVTAPGTGPLVASATAAGANTDPNTANNVAQATNVTITPSTDLATYLTAPASAAAGSTVPYTVITANNGPSNATNVVQTVTLPAGATGVTAPAGATITTTGGITTVTYTVASLPSGSSVSNTVTFVMPNVASAAGSASVPTANDPTVANNTSNATTTRPNIAPVAYDIVNTLQSPEGNTGGPLPISPLKATDADGTVATYQLLSIPATTQGVLYYNTAADGVSGTYVAITAANFAALTLTQAQADRLRFDPATGFAGSVFFNYQATDNLGAISAPARYTIQTAVDNPSLYANTPVKNNITTAYMTGNIIAYVVDPNGAAYNSAGIVYNPDGTLSNSGSPANGLNGTATAATLTPVGNGPGQAPAPATNPTNTLPPGISLNPNTGQIYVSNAALLPHITSATTYTVNITTVDVYGGVTTQPVSFTLGAYPLPVELLTFTAKAVRNVDSQLNWRTASEKNSDHWNIERSLNGRDFTKFAELAAKGSQLTPTDYILTDAKAAKLASTVYYRLQEVDQDGTTAYSSVQVVKFSQTVTATPVFSIYPNPANADVTVDLSALPTGSYTVTLVDMTGRLVQTLTLDAGLTQRLSLADYASGSYVVLVQNASGTADLHLTKRLVKE